MSLIPDAPVNALTDMFGRHGIEVEVSERGVKLTRADGRSYRMAVTEDNYVRGTALFQAGRVFEIDVFDLVYF